MSSEMSKSQGAGEDYLGPPPEVAAPPPYTPPGQEGAGTSASSAATTATTAVAGTADDELVPPAILVMGKLTIHAQTADGTPLYELSRDVRRSSEGETRVEFSRLDHVVRATDGAAPRVARRARHLFDFRRVIPLLAEGFPYRMHATARGGGSYAIRRLTFPRSGFKVVRPAFRDDHHGNKSGGLPKGWRPRPSGAAPEVDVAFEVVVRRHGHSEWVDGADGRRLAVEDETADGDLQLAVIAPLPRPVLDALVASWCLKVWYVCIESAPKIKMRKSRSLLFSFFLFFFPLLYLFALSVPLFPRSGRTEVLKLSHSPKSQDETGAPPALLQMVTSRTSRYIIKSTTVHIQVYKIFTANPTRGLARNIPCQ